MKKVSDVYFNSTKYNDDADYHRFYLGEDRYLTHLLMEIEPWRIGFCDLAKCKTDAPKTLLALLKQRRRWYLGHLSNDIWTITSLKIWKQYPILCIFNTLNNIRNTSVYIYLLYIVILYKNIDILTWAMFIFLPLILNWIFLIFYCLRLGRKMNIIFYPVFLLIQPIMTMIFMYYTIWTIRQRSWGGERVDIDSTKVSVGDIENQI